MIVKKKTLHALIVERDFIKMETYKSILGFIQMKDHFRAQNVPEDFTQVVICLPTRTLM